MPFIRALHLPSFHPPSEWHVGSWMLMDVTSQDGLSRIELQSESITFETTWRPTSPPLPNISRSFSDLPSLDPGLHAKDAHACPSSP